MSYTTVATQLIERDFQLLRGLFESRVMTVSHCASLYFGGSIEAARKRIWKLKNARLVDERTRSRPFDPSILHITRKGFERLSTESRLIDYPTIGWPTMEKRTRVSPLTLQHELDVMTAKCALVSAVAKSGTHRVPEFSTWPRLFAFQSRQTSPHGYARRVWIKPDGFVRIREKDVHGFDENEDRFYLELDRSTESLARLQAKAGAYADHYRSGGLAQRFGAPAEAFAEFPFRVLLVCRTTERRNNAARAMLKRHVPILTMVWITTFEELCRDPFGPVWIRPLDYRDATKGTPFDPYLPPDGNSYRRETAREELIDRSIQTHALLGAA